MRLYEHEGKRLCSLVGIPVPAGEVVGTTADARRVAEKLGGQVVLKAQVLAGSRGKAGGIKMASNGTDAERVARELLGLVIKGNTVAAVLVEDKLSIEREMYLGITYDDVLKANVLVFSSLGGMDVEEMALKNPGAIRRFPLDTLLGLPSYRAKEIAKTVGFGGSHLRPAAQFMELLFGLYNRFDATLAEINPLVLTTDGRFVAVDVRINVDDDAMFRQTALRDLGINPREDKGRPQTELERKAEEVDHLDHRGVAGRMVQFDGDIGLIIGGGGASLTVFDAILHAGGKPANYCEIGGNPTVKKVQELTKLIVRQPQIKCLGVITNVISNTRVDLVARGVIKGLLESGINPKHYPVVFRSAGSWEKDGYRILDKYGVKWFDRTHSMDEAARYLVALNVEMGGIQSGHSR